MLDSQRDLLSPSRLVRSQVVLEEHDPLPDGSGAVAVRRFVHGETYRSHLVLVPFPAGAARRPAARPRSLTGGAVRDTRPRLAPDGRRVTFLRSFPDEPERPTAVMVLALAGGEPWLLWAPEHGVSEAAWSPDGRLMAFVAAARETRFIVGREKKGRSVTARRVTRTDWRLDETGHRDRWSQVWVSPVRPGARPVRLTDGEADAKSIAWAPDGRSIAFVADPRPGADLRPLPSIWVVPAGGGVPREAVRLSGYADLPAFSPGGRWLACVGVDVADPLDDEIPGLFVAPFDPDGDGPAAGVPLAPGLDRPVGAVNDTDLNGWMAASRVGPSWATPEALVCLVSEEGRVRPWRFPFDPRPAAPPAPRSGSSTATSRRGRSAWLAVSSRSSRLRKTGRWSCWPWRRAPRGPARAGTPRWAAPGGAASRGRRCGA